MQYPTFDQPGTEARKSETFVMKQNRLMKEEADAVAKSKIAPNEEKRETSSGPSARLLQVRVLCARSLGAFGVVALSRRRHRRKLA